MWSIYFMPELWIFLVNDIEKPVLGCTCLWQLTQLTQLLQFPPDAVKCVQNFSPLVLLTFFIFPSQVFSFMLSYMHYHSFWPNVHEKSPSYAMVHVIVLPHTGVHLLPILQSLAGNLWSWQYLSFFHAHSFVHYNYLTVLNELCCYRNYIP